MTRIVWFVTRVSTALALAAAPYHVTIDGKGAARIVFAAAHAEDGGSGGGGSGGDGGGKGDGGGGGGAGEGGGSGDGSNSGNSSGGGGNAHSHVNPATGDTVKVQARGKTIEVVHPDGMKEKVERGRYEMLDALGRTIVDRAATAADMKRLQGM